MAKISFKASSSQSVSPAGISEQSTVNDTDDQKTLLVDSNVTLPSFADVKRGFYVTIKSVTPNEVTISANGNNKLDSFNQIKLKCQICFN